MTVKEDTPKAKRDALRKAIQRDSVKNGIVFCNRKRDVDTVARSLVRHGFSAAPIHGDLEQSQRTKTLDDFKTGKILLLVASDVAARGLDIPAVSHVFNFDVSRNADDYVHRIGRTGRAGKTGEAVTLVTGSDKLALNRVVKLIGDKPPELNFEANAESMAAQDDKPKAEPEKKPRDKVDNKAENKRADSDKIEPPKPRKAKTQSANSRPGRDNRSKSSEPDIVHSGFGEHVPDFMLRSAL